MNPYNFSLISLLILLAIMVIRVVHGFVSVGPKRKICELSASVQSLINHRDSRISLVIRARAKGVLIQFRCKGVFLGDGVELWLDNCAIDPSSGRWVRAYAEKMSLPFRVFSDDVGNVFLVVKFPQGADAPAFFAERLLVEQYGMQKDELVNVRFDVHSTSLRSSSGTN